MKKDQNLLPKMDPGISIFLSLYDLLVKTNVFQNFNTWIFGTLCFYYCKCKKTFFFFPTLGI